MDLQVAWVDFSTSLNLFHTDPCAHVPQNNSPLQESTLNPCRRMRIAPVYVGPSYSHPAYDSTRASPAPVSTPPTYPDRGTAEPVHCQSDEAR